MKSLRRVEGFHLVRVGVLFVLLMALSIIIYAGPNWHPVKGIKFDTDGDDTWETYNETDVERRINVTNYADNSASDVLTYSGTDNNWVSRDWVDIGPEITNLSASNINAGTLNTNRYNAAEDLALHLQPNPGDIIRQGGADWQAISQLPVSNFSAEADLTAELSPATSDTAVFDGANWIARSMSELNPANMVTVAPYWADYTTIQGAINSITDNASDNRYVVYVYPGTYDERVTSKDYVSLIGTDRQTCRIISNKDQTGGGAHTGFVVKITNGELRNFYIENTRTSYPSVAVTMTGNGLVKNCDLVSNENDTLYLYGSSCAGRVENCNIKNYDTGSQIDCISIDSDSTIKLSYLDIDIDGGGALWITGSPTIQVYKCDFKVAGTYPGINVTDAGETIAVYLRYCTFLDGSGEGDIMGTANGSNTTVYYAGCTAEDYGNSNATFTDLGFVHILTNKGATIKGGMSAKGTSTFLWDVDDSWGVKWNPAANTNFGAFEGTNDGISWNVNFYIPVGVEGWKTDDLLDCDSLKTNGTTRISNAGAITNCTANASLLTAGTLNNARVNWAAPSAYGSGTPNAVSATTVGSTGNATFGDASTDDFVVADDDPVFTNLAVQGQCNLLTYNTTSKVVGYQTYANIVAGCGACPIVFYRVDGGEWECAGEIIKDSNGNIFEGIVELGYVGKSVAVQIINLKDETDYIDYVAFLKILEPEIGVLKHKEYPVKDRYTGKKDRVYRQLGKGEMLEYAGDIEGRIGLKIMGYYTKGPIPSDETKEQNLRFFEERDLLDPVKIN